MNLVAALILGLLTAPAGDELRVLSFNIRYDNPRDGLDTWRLRRPMVAGLIRFHRPDVVGLQEALPHQVKALAADLPDYDWYGLGRDPGGKGETCAIFYRRDRLERLDGATFWLSSTPEEARADWGAKLRRICTWAELRLRGSKRRVRVFNTHFDHQSGRARLESARLIAKRATGHDVPVVVMGDLNTTPSSNPIRVLDGSGLRDAARYSDESPWGPVGTFTGFGKGFKHDGRRIDYIFVRGAVSVRRYGAISDTWEGRPPSDHRPVLADLLLGGDPVPGTLNLVEDWVFVPPAGTGESTLRAGASWEQQGVVGNGIGIYRKSVNLPSTWRGDGVTLEASGIADEADVFVDGALQTWTTDRNLSLEIPADRLAWDRPIELEIRVRDRGGWGGLTGLVRLHRGIRTGARPPREAVFSIVSGRVVRHPEQNAPVALPGGAPERAFSRRDAWWIFDPIRQSDGADTITVTSIEELETVRRHAPGPAWVRLEGQLAPDGAKVVIVEPDAPCRWRAPNGDKAHPVKKLKR